MKHDLLADMFCTVKNAEALGKTDCMVPASNLIRSVLAVMEKDRYIGGSEYVEDGRGGRIKVSLIKRVNSAGVIKPRFSVTVGDFDRYEKRFLPAVGRGILIVSTSKGVMDHNTALKEKTGGSLLGYVY